jgi:hypothetical protein
MALLTLNGDRIVLNGATLSLGGAPVPEDFSLSGVISQIHPSGEAFAQVIFDGAGSGPNKKYVTGGFWKRT